MIKRVILNTFDCFKELSSDVKSLYGLMSDRMSLSIKKQWFDNENRAYIYFSIEDIMELFLRLIGRIVLIPVWIVWLLIGAAADTLIGVAYAVKGMIGFVLTV